MLVVPGLVDMHVHLREPGFTSKETIETGTMAAAVGGFTSVCCMPNTNPVTDSVQAIEYINRVAKTDARVNVYIIGAISLGSKGEVLSPIGALKFAGAVGISDDGRPVANPLLMKRALQYASGFDMAVISHCEDLTLVNGGDINEGATATRYGLKGIDNASEEVMVARDIILAENTNTSVHIAHISTAGSVRLIRDAKSRGVKVTCETCPHYFTLTDEACADYNTNAKVNPPLRSHADKAAIIEGIIDGTIDVIATDHAPHAHDDKACEFDKAANGISGLETALSLCLTHLIKPGHISIQKLIYMMTAAPSRILGLNKGELAIGKTADITVIDPNKQYTITAARFKSKGKNTPFDGHTVTGKAIHTIVNGAFALKNETIV